MPLSSFKILNPVIIKGWSMMNSSMRLAHYHCTEQQQDHPLPDQQEFMRRYMIELNNIISLGEALAQTSHVPAPPMEYLRTAFNKVHDAAQDPSVELG